MLKKLALIILIITLSSTVFSACMDASEVDDNVYAVVIGLDKGINNKVILTIQYPVYKSSKEGTSEAGASIGRGGSNTHSIEAPALLGGIDMMNMAVSRRILLMHTKMLVIGEEFAREGIGDFLAPLARFRGSRRTMFVVVTKGKAMDFMEENKTNIGDSITKSMELMIEQSKTTGFFPNTNFHEFYRDILSNYGQASAIYAGINNLNKMGDAGSGKPAPLITERDVKAGELPRVGTTKREFVGTALFRGDKMVGVLNPYETRYMLMLKNKFKKGIMTIEDQHTPGKGIIFNIRNGRATKIHCSCKGKSKRPEIDINLNIEADIGAIHSRENYENPKLIEDLNDQLSERIKEGVEKLIKKTQKEYKTDVFEFGAKLAGSFKTIPEWEKYNWLSHYTEAKVNVSVEVNVRRTGLMIDSSQIQGSPEFE